MKMILKSLALLTIAAGCATGAPGRKTSPEYQRDSAAIRSAILRGASGFERGDAAAILAHYSRDIVLAYPGIPDMNYADLERSYKQRPANEKATTVPTFDEILVSGDIALVRLRWLTTINTPERTSVRRLKDFQVWRRDRAGRWTFIRGMHYREPESSGSR